MHENVPLSFTLDILRRTVNLDIVLNVHLMKDEVYITTTFISFANTKSYFNWIPHHRFVTNFHYRCVRISLALSLYL